MSKLKVLSAALIVASAIATPALAAGGTSRHMSDGYSRVESASICVRAPRVGAFATQPWTDAAPCEPNTMY
jgi:hypothetical protein